MTPAQARVVEAEAQARAARHRLDGSVSALQQRLRPATLMRAARREISGRTETALRAVDDRQRQVRIGGGVVAAVLLAVPLLRWRKRRKTARRAARIRGE